MSIPARRETNRRPCHNREFPEERKTGSCVAWERCDSVELQGVRADRTPRLAARERRIHEFESFLPQDHM